MGLECKGYQSKGYMRYSGKGRKKPDPELLCSPMQGTQPCSTVGIHIRESLSIQHWNKSPSAWVDLRKEHLDGDPAAEAIRACGARARILMPLLTFPQGELVDWDMKAPGLLVLVEQVYGPSFLTIY